MPKKLKDSFYFSHDGNARNDPKIVAMRAKYGCQGYGLYWIIVEMLREEKDYKLPLEDFIYYAISRQSDVPPDEVKGFIESCLVKPSNLFKKNKTHFWSDSLVSRMKIRENKSEQARKAAKKRWGKSGANADAERPLSDSNAIKKEIKKLKKESKVKKKILSHLNPAQQDQILQEIAERKIEIDEGFLDELEEAILGNKKFAKEKFAVKMILNVLNKHSRK